MARKRKPTPAEAEHDRRRQEERRSVKTGKAALYASLIPGRPAIETIAVKLGASKMPKLSLLEEQVRCSWCGAPATTWFRDRMACKVHENVLQWLAIEFVDEQRERRLKHEKEWWD